MKYEVRTRDTDHVERLAAALIQEEASFDVRPESNGWWVIRVKLGGRLLYGNFVDQIAQATRLDPAVRS